MEYFENYEEAQLLGELIEIYYAVDGNGVGGNLHVVLDDGNLDDESIKWCIGECLAGSDHLGAEIAKRLMGFDEEARGLIMQGSSSKIVSRVCWVSVKDRLPVPSLGYGRYLAVVNPYLYPGSASALQRYRQTLGVRVVIFAIGEGNHMWTQEGEDVSDRVTHWAKLPDISQIG
jgi:hypothetical protein